MQVYISNKHRRPPTDDDDEECYLLTLILSNLVLLLEILTVLSPQLSSTEIKHQVYLRVFSLCISLLTN